MEEDTDVPTIPQKWMSVITNGAVARIKDFQDRNSTRQFQLYEAGVERMIAKDGINKGIYKRMKDQFRHRTRRGPFFKTGGFIY